ncbi:MAG: ABC transporter substrate-binding protein, partial [Desulfobacterales bacterium]|nr:ABC transporter substrate-binding protein [Desulfobacterales bacterium]
MKFKFFAERENAFESFKKGMIDLFPIYTARIWVNETKGDDFLKNRIVKQKIYNYNPIGFQGFAMNMRRPPFDDIRVRKAMAFLLDRRKMNSALMYGQYFLHKSYFEDLYTKQNPCSNQLAEMDKEKARNLLGQAG